MTPAASIRSAVILWPEPSDPGAQAPFQTVAGLPLLLRQLLWLGEHGIAAVQLVAPGGTHAVLAARLAAWRGKRSLPRIDLIAAEVPGGGATAEPAVVLDARFLHHPALLAHALAQPAPFVYGDAHGNPCGLGVAEPRAVLNGGGWGALPRVNLPDGCFARSTAGTYQVRAAERLLYQSFIKPTDGWFSRNLDRPVSLSITRRIIALPLHPHPITGFAFLVGLAAAWCAAQPGFGFLLAGGALFLAASILDGVDGELARAKFLHSKTGEWLDTVCDDLTNFVFIAGVTWGIYRRGAEVFWLALGALSLVLYALSLLRMYSDLIITGRRGSLLEFQQVVRKPGYRAGPLRAWMVSLQPLIKRDFYAWAFMVCSLLDWPKLILAGWTLAAVLVFAFIGTGGKNLFAGADEP